jgi:CHAT domain-containing protein
MSTIRFALDWHSGPTAQIELFDANGARSNETEELYNLRFTPPFRATLRVPLERRQLVRAELKPISDDLDRFVAAPGDRRAATADAVSQAPPPEITALERMGRQLYQCTMPRHAQADLRADGLFLEIGVDERLVDLPWELMHDGDDFLCRKHSVGRYVNVSARPIAAQEHEQWQPGSTVIDELSVLIISVPNPQPRADGTRYQPLGFAEAEALAMMETLSGMDGVKPKLLHGRNATRNNVWEALQERHHIVHYTGHAHFDRANPRQSALVLDDQDMSAAPVSSFFGGHPPLLFFMNACETGAAPAWQEQYDFYGLAWAFLETGGYLLGSCWQVKDDVAKDFAVSFYETLLGSGAAIGAAVTRARQAAFRDDDFGWASYVLYGDPRLAFRPQRGAGAPAGPSPPSSPATTSSAIGSAPASEHDGREDDRQQRPGEHADLDVLVAGAPGPVSQFPDEQRDREPDAAKQGQGDDVRPGKVIVEAGAGKARDEDGRAGDADGLADDEPGDDAEGDRVAQRVAHSGGAVDGHAGR